ncbi:MAG: C39 family peptidase [Pseudomonadota bacterium]
MRTLPLIPIALAWLLGAPVCAGAVELAQGGARYVLPLTSLKEIRFRTTMRQQYDFSCGSAAVATLLSHHYGYRVTEQQVFAAMYLHGEQQKIRKEGFSLLDVQRFLAGIGFQADGFELPLDKLVQARLPAIVLVAEKGYSHFVVIKGVADGRVLIGDPANGTRALPRPAFEAIWRNKLLFVIHDHAGAVRFNSEDDWRAAPSAPVAQAINRAGLDTLTLAKRGPGDF